MCKQPSPCCHGVYRLGKVVEKDYTHMRTHDHIYTVPVKSTSCPPKQGLSKNGSIETVNVQTTVFHAFGPLALLSCYRLVEECMFTFIRQHRVNTWKMLVEWVIKKRLDYTWLARFIESREKSERVPLFPGKIFLQNFVITILLITFLVLKGVSSGYQEN